MSTLKKDLEALLEGREVSVRIAGKTISQGNIDKEIQSPDVRMLLIALVGTTALLKDEKNLIGIHAQVVDLNAKLGAAYTALHNPGITTQLRLKKHLLLKLQRDLKKRWMKN